MDISQNIYTQFKLPIQYIHHIKIENNLLQDIEMKGDNNMISTLMGSTSPYGHLLWDMWSSQYTTNVDFLKEFQKLMKKYKSIQLEPYDYMKTWTQFKQQTAFKEKYAFLEWQHLDICNRSSQCMQLMSCYNLASPVLNLCIPFFFLLFPFVLMKCIHKIPITFSAYKVLLFKQLKHNVFGKFIQEFSTRGNWDKKNVHGIRCMFLFFQHVSKYTRLYSFL